MERKKRPKSLRGGKGTLASTTSLPQYHCRNHGALMPYNPLVMGWECPEPGCTYRRYRKSEVDQYGPPLVCEGPYSIVLYGNQIILRGSNNVAADITSIVTDMGQITSASGHMSVELTMEFTSITQISQQP